MEAIDRTARRVISEITADLARSTPMNRLVQGDVGSGKTMIAAAAAYCAAKSGRQAALMVPTEILAEQHAAALAPLMAPFGIRTVLLTGSLGARQRREATDAIVRDRLKLSSAPMRCSRSRCSFRIWALSSPTSSTASASPSAQH